jgi:hypothetical protein
VLQQRYISKIGENMRRNPLYVFKNEDTTGVYDVPLHSVIQILETRNGRVLVVEIIGKAGLNPASTIKDLLDRQELYTVLSDGTGGGELAKYIEDNRTGYKLWDAILNDYGPIGDNSIDFSFQDGLFTGTG